MSTQRERPTKSELVAQFAELRQPLRAGYSPAKGDAIRWSEQRNGRKRTYAGKVQTVHADRWTVMVGPGRLHSLARVDWDATGEVVESASGPQLVLVLVTT